MGLKDMLSSEGRESRKIAKLKKKLTQRFGQPEDRERAAFALRDIGTEDAIWVLLQRFTFTTEKATADMDEKQRIHEMLVDFGEKAVPMIKKFIEKHSDVAWPIRTLRRILPSEEVNGFVFDYLKDATSEEDDPLKLCEMTLALRNVKDPGVVPVVVPLLNDYDDTVRFAAVETLQDVGDPAAREPLLEALVSEDEDSMRVKLRILDAIQANGWEVKGFRKVVEEMLPEASELKWGRRDGWRLDRGGKIVVLEELQKSE